MPLKNRDSHLPSRPANSLDQTQERHNHHDALDRSSTLKASQMIRSTSIASDDSKTSNPLGARDVPDQDATLRQKAMSLKMNVPSNPFESRLGAASSQEGPRWSKLVQSVHSGGHPEPQSTFDNTESITWDEDSAIQETENQTIVFLGDQGQVPRNNVDKRGGTQHRDSKGSEDVPRVPHAPMHFGAGFEDEIAEGRKIFEQNSRGRITPVNILQDSEAAGIMPDLSVEEPINSLQPIIIDTPSRATTMPLGRNIRSFATTSKTVSFESPAIRSRELAKADSPALNVIPQTIKNTPRGAHWVSQGGNRILNVDRQKNRNDDGPSKMRSQTYHQDKDAPESRPLNAFEPSHESDYPTSEDDLMSNPGPPSTSLQKSSPSKQESRKRGREQELDFDTATLKTMPYEDLVDQNFDTDPRNTAENDVFDIRGNAKSLPQRLSNLSRMSEEEQRAMFRGQTDVEWTQIGSWFIDKFQGDLRRLMENKIERRKVSMRFENEVRRRQATVKRSLAGVEEELNSLKKGGGELIRGRDTASRRNTPQKRS